MTPEKRVKTQVVQQLKEIGAYYFYPVTGGYGSSGVPDIVGCFRGFFFAIECKAGKGTTTALQDMNIHKIKLAGGKVWVVNEDNVDSVSATLYRVALNG
jgi:Holliday junction resolvase